MICLSDESYAALLERSLTLEARLGRALRLVDATQAEAYARGHADGLSDGDQLRRQERTRFASQAARMRTLYGQALGSRQETV